MNSWITGLFELKCLRKWMGNVTVVGKKYIKIPKERKELCWFCSAILFQHHLIYSWHQPLQKGKSPEWRLWLVISKCQQMLWTLLLVASTPEPFPSLLRLLSSHWQVAWKLGRLEGLLKDAGLKRREVFQEW